MYNNIVRTIIVWTMLLYTHPGFRYCGQATHEDFTDALLEFAL